MASVESVVEELRVRNRSGAYRVFYYTKLADFSFDLPRFCKENAEDAAA